MAGATITKRPSSPVSIQHDNPFTTTDSDVFPPLSSLLSSDTSHPVADPSTQEMSAYARLQDENDLLKAKLAEFHSQRQTEQHAYSVFIKSAESLNTQLTPQARTPAMMLAMKNLVDSSRAYRTLANTLNQKYDNIPVSLTPSPEKHRTNQTTSSARLADTTVNSHPTSLQGQPGAYHLQESNSTSRHRQVALMTQNTLAQLQVSRPPNSQPFDTTLAHLKNNIESFTPFIVLYLNGRHRHLTSGLRAQINRVVGGLFDDPEDARQIIDKIMKVLKEGIRYVDKDVQGLGADIIAPMGAVLWALVGFLDNEV